MGKFFDVVSNEEAQKLIVAGRQPYEYKTKNPAKGPIFGPGYDHHASLNRAKQENRFATTLEEAQQCAKAAGTSIEGVIFLVGK